LAISQRLSDIRAAVAVDLAATISPGAANPTIMSVAMRWGATPLCRWQGGIITVFLFWGLVAASGLSIPAPVHRSSEWHRSAG